MQGAQVQSLVGELRSHMLYVVQPKEKRKPSTAGFQLNSFNMANYMHRYIRSWTFVRLVCQFTWWYSSDYSEVVQSCPALCEPMDCSLPSSSVHRIFQARILEWVAISFSRGSSQHRDQTWVSHIIGRRFPVWATREALYILYIYVYTYIHVCVCVYIYICNMLI